MCFSASFRVFPRLPCFFRAKSFARIGLIATFAGVKTIDAYMYVEDLVLGNRLLISEQADTGELASNIRAARAILSSFPELTIIINPHRLVFGLKNPEYTINNELGDRKGIMGEKGITAGFKSAKKQGCKIVVIDLDEHLFQVRPFELSKYIARRRADFINGIITDCYVVFNGQAVRLNARYQSRREMESHLEMLRP